MERVATADARALPPMISGSSSSLNERGVITKNTMCDEHSSDMVERMMRTMKEKEKRKKPDTEVELEDDPL